MLKQNKSLARLHNGFMLLKHQWNALHFTSSFCQGFAPGFLDNIVEQDLQIIFLTSTTLTNINLENIAKLS